MEYKIDIEKITCTCPDFKFRRFRKGKNDLERRCKHLQEAMKYIPVSKSSNTWSEKKRHPRKSVEKVGKRLSEIFKTFSTIEKFEFCGSFRRGKSTIGDLDIVISKNNDYWTDNPDILKRFESCADKVMVSGRQKTSMVIDGIQVDFRFVISESFIFQVMHATGSMKENIRLRAIAKRKGMKLNEYGLQGVDGNLIQGLNSEQDIYIQLNENFKKPNLR